MKKIISFIIVLTFVNVLEGVAMDKINKEERDKSIVAVKVKELTDEGIIILKNGNQVSLIGIAWDSISSRNKKKLSKFLIGQYVVFVRDELGKNNEGYLYLIDYDDGFLPDNLLGSNPDRMGFLNVKKGWDKVKVLAPNINVALVKLGYVRVDKSKDFKYKNEFIEYENNISQ